MPDLIELVEVTYEGRKDMWEVILDQSKLFLGSIEEEVMLDTDQNRQRYIIKVGNKPVGGFSLKGNHIITLMIEPCYEREEFLTNLVKIFEQLVNDRNKLQVHGPETLALPLQPLGFKKKVQRYRMTLDLSQYNPPSLERRSDVTRIIQPSDLFNCAEVIVDGYKGTVDEALFGKENASPEQEVKDLETLYTNLNKEFRLIEKASLLHEDITKKQILGIVISTLWFGIPLIYDLVVKRSVQGQGVGRRLMEEGLTELRSLGYPQVALFVTEGNEGAIRLYHSLGFIKDTINMASFERESAS